MGNQCSANKCSASGTLLLALISGIALSGSYYTLFNQLVPLSLFPLLTLALAVGCLHQRYLHHEMALGLPKLVAGCFLLGLLLYTSIVRALYPQIGSNFIPAVLCVVLALWIGIKLKSDGKIAEQLKQPEEVGSE